MYSVATIRNSTHSMVECRKHTLEIIKMLQDKILVDGRADLFYQVMTMYILYTSGLYLALSYAFSICDCLLFFIRFLIILSLIG